MIKTLSILLITAMVSAPSLVDKLGFYRVFEGNSKTKMEQEIAKLEELTPSNRKDAYIGALTMKRSQFEKTPKDKATMFKAGRDLLEKAIEQEKDNAEFRFLRLAIQENVPKILKYNSDLGEDSALIEKRFKELDTTVKQVIKRYAEQSDYISPSQLK